MVPTCCVMKYPQICEGISGFQRMARQMEKEIQREKNEN